MKTLLIYVAGPYSKGDVCLNIREVIEIAEQIRHLGHLPFVPHLFHLWHLMSPHDREYWLKMDLEMLERCDALFLLEGESPGAEIETQAAFSSFKPVYTSLLSLKEVTQCESK